MPRRALGRAIETSQLAVWPRRLSDARLGRLVGMILAEQDHERQDGRRYFRLETLALIDAEPDIEEAPMLMAS